MFTYKIKQKASKTPPTKDKGFKVSKFNHLCTLRH